MKTPPNLQRFSCTLELAFVQDREEVGENVIRLITDNGQDLLSLSLSPEIGQYLASAHAEALVTINLDGSVGVMFDNELNSTPQSPSISLDQLVANAVSSDMLEDEPDAAAMLAKLRARLLKSLKYVDQAIATLAKA
ncbi:MAG: hypothetical protein M3O03_09165 [Pseudomonadota bacterium]|nr:hypothetical protein [Pseudomonadota bacterium]